MMTVLNSRQLATYRERFRALRDGDYYSLPRISSSMSGTIPMNKSSPQKNDTVLILKKQFKILPFHAAAEYLMDDQFVPFFNPTICC
jgi:hypothetical protein